ncbi:MAG TPA: 4-hydroxythreonine-4-phosphate dehydrogenase PdxA [Xanthomonadaceae bacterium]|nr:4-hydroxythreonine-4-phosphate dehydrogenase PdxA [Xanthomonadaceae bacterium]
MSDARLALTPGEPAGIGPDLAVMLAQAPLVGAALVAVADPDLLAVRASALGLPCQAIDAAAVPVAPGQLSCLPVPLARAAEPGRLDSANAPYVLDCLRIAADGCLRGCFSGMVTGPVHKGIINEAGIVFSGHTEFLAERAGVAQVVMMLVAGDLRVALATTHLPLAHVPAAITPASLESTLRILHRDLVQRFDIAAPRIAVLGLNPHAGEGGHIGREEIDVIEPVLARLRGEGMQLDGPLAADTAFVPDRLRHFDAVLAMYHDQGLPVLKHAGFGEAVNITLGLPFVRTSVDHGVALDQAGSGGARDSSLRAALAAALAMVAAQGR